MDKKTPAAVPMVHDVTIITRKKARSDVKTDEEYEALRRREVFLRRGLLKYLEFLDRAAVLFRSDKTRGAYDAVMASIKYLAALRQEPHLRAPLLEAAEILKSGLDVKPEELSKDTMIKVFSAIALDLQMECKPRPVLNDAAKKVVGNDPKAVDALIDSRKKIKTQDIPKGSKKLFWEIKRKILKDYPIRDEAIARALKGVRAMRGEKV
jgi:hypothetical protein